VNALHAVLWVRLICMVAVVQIYSQVLLCRCPRRVPINDGPCFEKWNNY